VIPLARPRTAFRSGHRRDPQPIESFGSPQAIGGALFSEYLLPFEITSVLLLVAMLGAIILTKSRKGEGQMVPVTYYVALSAVLSARRAGR
jgi:hypothetical protein